MLIIIDMQKCFPGSKKALPQVLREIRKAKRNKEFIVTVQYGFGSRSLTAITRELRHTKHLSVNKSSNDGGIDIFHALVKCDKSNNLGAKGGIKFANIRKLRVCGVNTSACVMCTVETLSKLRIPVQVISRACVNCFPEMSEKYNISKHNDALKTMSKWTNVEVV